MTLFDRFIDRGGFPRAGLANGVRMADSFRPKKVWYQRRFLIVCANCDSRFETHCQIHLAYHCPGKCDR